MKSQTYEIWYTVNGEDFQANILVTSAQQAFERARKAYVMDNGPVLVRNLHTNDEFWFNE